MFECCVNGHLCKGKNGSGVSTGYIHNLSVFRERPHEQEVVGSIPGCNKPKSVKLVVVAFPLGAQDYWNSSTTDLPKSG